MFAALSAPRPARTFSRAHFAHRPLKAKLAGELAAAADESERKEIKAEFEARERALEHDIDHTPRELSMAEAPMAPSDLRGHHSDRTAPSAIIRAPRGVT